MKKVAVALLASGMVISIGLLFSACGGGSPPSVASLGTTTTIAPTSQDTGTSATKRQDAVKFSECMRSHGVKNYPDPKKTGATEISSSSGIDPNSQTFQSAWVKCAKYSPSHNVKTHASEQQIKTALKTAECMHAHGVPNFPDPIATSAPPTPGSEGPGLTQYNNGILFHIPSSIEVSSPTFQAAAKACHFTV